MSLSEVADWVKSASGESSQAYRSPRLWETWQGEDSPNGTLRWSDSGNCKSSQKMKALGLTDCQSALAIATLILRERPQACQRSQTGRSLKKRRLPNSPDSQTEENLTLRKLSGRTSQTDRPLELQEPSKDASSLAAGTLKAPRR